jgi:hypothetical protein
LQKIKYPLAIFLLILFSLVISISPAASQTDDPVMFYDGFESEIPPFFDEAFSWKSVQLGYTAKIITTPTRYGNQAVQFTLNYDDGWFLPASQWRLNNPEELHHFEMGSTHWYGFSIYLPEGFKINDQPEIVNEFLSKPDLDLGEIWERNAPAALIINGRNWEFVVNSDADENSSDGFYDTTHQWELGNWQDGQWTDWVYHIKWSYEEDGFLQVWQNGDLVIDYVGPTTFNDETGPFWKIGIHERSWIGGPSDVLSRTIFYDEVRVASQSASYADVAPGDDEKPKQDDTSTTIQIYAAGRTGEENMDLIIDNETVASYINVGGDYFEGDFEVFTYEYNAAVTPERIRVFFANDTWGRDIRVDKITINGAVYESEEAYSTGAWNEADGCTEGYFGSEYLYCTGYFEFRPETTNLVDISEGLFVSPEGDNENEGSLERPFQTIQYAIDQANPGDTIYLREGTYVERVIIDKSGEINNPITLAAYPGEQPIIDGQYSLPTGEPARCNDTVTPPKCFVYSALLDIKGSYIVVRGVEIMHSRGRGVTVSNPDGERPHHVTIEQCSVHDTRNAAVIIRYADHITVQDCDIYHAGDFAPNSRPSSELDWPVAVNAIRSTNVLFTRNTIHENWTEGIATGSDSRNIQIVDNVIYDNYALQIYVHRAQDLIVAQNLVYHTNNPAFHRGGNPSQCIVLNNETQFEGALTLDNVQVVNNLVAGCRKNIAIWGSEGSGLPVKNVLIAHNTLVDAVSNTSTEPVGLDVAGNANMTNVQIINNIVMQSEGVVAYSPNDSQVVFDNNLWSRTPSGNAASSNDIISDAQLVHANMILVPGQVESDWFTLQSNSPAIDQGRSTSIENDYHNQIRDSRPDIGAVEFVP